MNPTAVSTPPRTASPPHSTDHGRNSDERLSISPHIRIPIIALSGFLAGSALGLSHGGQTAALRFRAENAHRLPTSQKGWYYYHKSKNYHTMLGAIKEGMKMGAKIGFWAGAFVTMEDAVDQCRGGDKHKDFLSTVVAALTTSGLFSLWNRFSLPTAARTTKMAFKIGLGYGLLQDMFGLLQGRKLAYVEILRSNT